MRGAGGRAAGLDGDRPGAGVGGSGAGGTRAPGSADGDAVNPPDRGDRRRAWRLSISYAHWIPSGARANAPVTATATSARMSAQFVVPVGLFASWVGVGAWPVDECPRLTAPRVTPCWRSDLRAGLPPEAVTPRDAPGSDVPAPSADPVVEPAAATAAAVDRASAQGVDDAAARSDTSARCSRRCSWASVTRSVRAVAGAPSAGLPYSPARRPSRRADTGDRVATHPRSRATSARSRRLAAAARRCCRRPRSGVLRTVRDHAPRAPAAPSAARVVEPPLPRAPEPVEPGLPVDPRELPTPIADGAPAAELGVDPPTVGVCGPEGGRTDGAGPPVTGVAGTCEGTLTVPAGAGTDGAPTDGTETDGVVTDGTETDGVVTDGTETDGVVTDGTETDGVVTDGTETDGVVTDGTVTDGAVTDGAVTDGTALGVARASAAPPSAVAISTLSASERAMRIVRDMCAETHTLTRTCAKPMWWAEIDPCAPGRDRWERSKAGLRRNPMPALGIMGGVPQMIDVCPLSEFPPGESRLVAWEDLEIGVFNCAGSFYAIEDRCSHDDGPLAEGTFDPDTCTVECPRHGSLFDLATGKPKTLPAYVPVDTFPVIIEDDTIKLEVE